MSAQSPMSPLEATCPITGGPMRPRLSVASDWRRTADPRKWEIFWSDRAKFGQIQPRPSPQDVAEFYDTDGYYTHSDFIAADSEEQAKAVGLTGRILGSLAYRFENGAEPTDEWWASVIPQSTTRALEIGSGDGDRMRTFTRHVEHVCGVEPDPRAVETARARGLEVYEGTAEHLPAEVTAHKYGLIAFVHVLEHTLDPVASLRNAGELLDDGGLLSCEVPNSEAIGAEMMGQAWRWLDAPRHLNFFTMESLSACAREAGLKVEAELYRGYVRQFMPDWLFEEALIKAKLEGRSPTKSDVMRQLRHSIKLFARTALARPQRKYDSIRILCRKA